MLNGKNKNTFHAIRLLCDTLHESNKPLVFWLGAGVSKWCGYPLWGEIADKLHSCFLKYEPSYDKEKAITLLSSKKYPDFFELCKIHNKKKYFSFLSKEFAPKKTTPIYERFVNILNEIKPVHIITTNVDEKLEASLTKTRTTQKTDIEYCLHSLNNQESFICKIHGSISSVNSMVFTSGDYANLIGDSNYITLLKYIFSSTNVVFIGYGLGDEYILKSLLDAEEIKPIFGDGPHFAILPEIEVTLPPSTKIISYITEPHRDHRSSIQVVNEIRIAKKTNNDKPLSQFESLKFSKISSSHLLSYIYPPGTWTNSQNFQFAAAEGDKKPPRSAYVGNGFDNSELPLSTSTAMHDVIVGLLCFDIVYCPLTALSRLHVLLGSDIFWELVKNGCLKFIEWQFQETIIYPHAKALTGGDLASVIALNRDNKEKTIQETIRKHLKPIPGREKTAGGLFSLLENNIKIIDRSLEPSVPDLVRGLLLRPSLIKMIGMSGGVLPTSIPLWMKFPVLRLANVVKIGCACQLLGIASTKLEFGTASLAGLAFSASSGKIATDEMASYVLTGRFDMDLGSLAVNDPSILLAILKFRDTQVGVSLRKDILEQLSLGLGSDFVTSVNASLSSSIPLRTLQAARDKLSGLLTPKDHDSGITTVVWNDIKYEENALSLWRKKSEKEFLEYCQKENINNYDLCPCGSGEKMKFCCKEALQD
jgi:hypothetical protein